jgi:hypothetical protein
MSKKIVGALLVIVIVFCNWGFLVHRTCHQLAIYQLPKPLSLFFYSQKKYLNEHAVRPDLRRSHDSTEAHKHYIDLEPFGDSAAWKMPLHLNDAINQYTIDTLKKYGIVPYWISVTMNRLTQAFKNKNKDSIIFYAADLGHYIEDAHVPLHTSINYDGQLTNQRGLHDLWESTVPEISISNYNLQANRKANYIQNIEQHTWQILQTSHQLLQSVFDTETAIAKGFDDSSKYHITHKNGKTRKKYTKEFAKQYAAILNISINNQLLASANAVADYWYTAWINAGSPNLIDLYEPFGKKYWRKERRHYRQNTLLPHNELLSIKTKNPEF